MPSAESRSLSVSLPQFGGKLRSIWLNLATPESATGSNVLLDVVVYRAQTALLKKSLRASHIRAAAIDDLQSLGDGIQGKLVGCAPVTPQRGGEPHGIRVCPVLGISRPETAAPLNTLMKRELRHDDPRAASHWPVYDISLGVGSLEGVERFEIIARGPVGILDVYAELRSEAACPFHSQSPGVSLAELGSVVRLGDRFRFDQAVSQFESALGRASDLDEARGLGLTFLAVIAAALLELGAPRSIHRHQLDVARALDRLDTAPEIAAYASEAAQALVLDHMPIGKDLHEERMKAALKMIDSSFAQPLQDTEVAREVGLSTSHFRYLFRQSTGEPFHKYLLKVRLEKARLLLQDHDLTVGEVTQMVGFVSPAHFTRSFSKVYGYSPSKIP